MTDMLERACRAFCDKEPLVPDADAPVSVGGVTMKSWEARKPAVAAAIRAVFEGREGKRVMRPSGKWGEEYWIDKSEVDEALGEGDD